MQDFIDHLTLAQGILGAAVFFGAAFLLGKLIDNGVELVRVLKGRTDADVEELARAVEELNETVRDCTSDQLDVLKDIEKGIGEIHETVTEIAGYRPVVDKV